MRRQPQGLSGDRGASLVEFALIAPLLFAILLGMVTGGFALATKNSMTNAVREGARVGATLPYDANWESSVRGVVKDLAGSDLDLADICAQMVEDPTTDPDPAEPAGCPDAQAVPATAECVVRVWATKQATLNALFFSRPVDMEARSVGIYEREGCP